MDKSINSTIAKYISLIKEKYSAIKIVYLFGSYAKGTSNEDSDIDVALIFSELEDTNKFNIQVQLMILAAQIDSRIEPHPISMEDFNSGNPFAAEIKKTGIELAA
ncbi:MAG: nucleotidyltransferase domain-containing protein [Bacteroidales bacterium]|nr:nucleotidyltransferase domain-containing protein [Bacteroidales bacterium]